MKLTEKEIKEILKNEIELFSGDRRAACAAHVHTPGVVMRCAGEPAFADKSLISNLKGQVTKYVNDKQKPEKK
jgi:hypothetical protein